MKLKNFIIIGYFISMIITVIAVVISVNVMLIDQHAAYFIVGIAVVASIIGFLVSFLLLQFVFSSAWGGGCHAPQEAERGDPPRHTHRGLPQHTGPVANAHGTLAAIPLQ